MREGRAATTGDPGGTDGDGLKQRSPGEDARDGGAEKCGGHGGGGVSWEGGGGSWLRRPTQLACWDGWHEEREEVEERDMEKDSDGDGVPDASGGRSCGEHINILEEAKIGDPSKSPSFGEGRLLHGGGEELGLCGE